MVTIVAETASAHEGKLKQIFRLIDAAKAPSADAMKFHIYKADMLSVKGYPFYDLYKRYMLSRRFAVGFRLSEERCFFGN